MATTNVVSRATFRNLAITRPPVNYDMKEICHTTSLGPGKDTCRLLKQATTIGVSRNRVRNLAITWPPVNYDMKEPCHVIPFSDEERTHWRWPSIALLPPEQEEPRTSL